jgi:hypothetical protein
MTGAVFESFIKNFRADPQYATGKLKVGDEAHEGGCRPVLQFDYEHASEMPPWEGSIASSGAPACGWVLEVEVRQGADGKAQLWALAQLGEQLRGQIARNEYRSVSIAFTLDGVHWVTGEPIGPVLTSIAITNHPFMRDLEPLAAANRPTGAPGARTVKRSHQPSEAPGARSSLNPGDHTMSDQLRERLCKLLKINIRLDDDAVGAAVEEAVEEGDTAKSGLKAVLEALGVADVDAVLKALPELQSAEEKLAAALAELQAIRGADASMDGEMSELDVAAAMSAQNYKGDGAKKALGAFRAQCVANAIAALAATKPKGDEPTIVELREARKKGRETFLTEYGVKDSDKIHLTRSLVAGPNGKQLEPPKDGKVLPIEERGSPEITIDLRGLKGRNTTEKLITHLTKNEPGFEKLSWERKVTRAGEVRRSAQLTVN